MRINISPVDNLLITPQVIVFSRVQLFGHRFITHRYTSKGALQKAQPPLVKNIRSAVRKGSIERARMKRPGTFNAIPARTESLLIKALIKQKPQGACHVC